MSSWRTRSASSGRIRRMIQTNWRSARWLRRRWMASASSPSTPASSGMRSAACSSSPGCAQTESTGVETASGWPLRSTMRPRMVGISTWRRKRASPSSWRNSVSMTCSLMARATRPTAARPINPIRSATRRRQIPTLLRGSAIFGHQNSDLAGRFHPQTVQRLLLDPAGLAQPGQLYLQARPLDLMLIVPAAFALERDEQLAALMLERHQRNRAGDDTHQQYAEQGPELHAEPPTGASARRSATRMRADRALGLIDSSSLVGRTSLPIVLRRGEKEGALGMRRLAGGALEASRMACLTRRSSSE